MASKRIKKMLALCLAAGLCMSFSCMPAMAVDGEEIIEEEIMLDENGLPLVDIPDEPIPITPLPPEVLDEAPADAEEVPEPTAPSEEIPDADIADEEIADVEDLPDWDVPLAEVPQTGDVSALWLAMSGAGLLGFSLLRAEEKKK